MFCRFSFPLIAVLAILPPAFGAPLTLEAAQHLALGQSRRLRAQDAAISAARCCVAASLV